MRTGQPPSSVAALDYQDSPGLLFGHQMTGPWARYFETIPQGTKFRSLGGGSTLPTSMEGLDTLQTPQAMSRPIKGRTKVDPSWSLG